MTAAVLTGAGRALPASYEQGEVWDGYFARQYAGLRAAERVPLDDEFSAHRFMDEIEGVTVGFTWTWPPGEEPRLGGG